MRKITYVVKLDNVFKHPNADSLVICKVGGWQCVSAMSNGFQTGDLAVYFAIDSWIPHTLAPFLTKGESPKVYADIPGNKLKTVKLRGELSQGLLMPIDILKQYSDKEFEVGEDVSELLGVIKWEPPIPSQLAGNIRTTFPSWLRKTDQERIQNCHTDIIDILHEEWVWEEKLDGSSMTVGVLDGDVHICSRNNSLQLDDMNTTYVRVAHEIGIVEALKAYGKNIGISGELCGEGIQKNRYNLKGHKWFVFDILDVDRQSYLSYNERQEVITKLMGLGAKIDQVPFLKTATLTDMTCEDLLLEAEEKSLYNSKQEREGIVFKNTNNPNVSFKAISNKFLLKGGD